jgi:hypothetical protein
MKFNLNIVENNIRALAQTHENAIAVMGGAYFAAQDIHQDTPNFNAFIYKMDEMIRQHLFRDYDEPLEKSMKTFCHLCMVDPALVEAYLGMKFKDIANEIRGRQI